MEKRLFNSKIFLAIVVLFCLALSGCQPEGGELLPIGGEGVEISTSRFENDTAVINDKGLKIRLYGSWSKGSYIHLRVIFINESNQEAQIDFGRAALKNGKNQVWNMIEIDEKPGSKPFYEKSNGKSLPAINLKTGEKKSFDVIFAPLTNFSNADEAEKTLTLELPVEISGGKANEHKAQFKAIGQKDASGKLDPEDK